MTIFYGGIIFYDGGLAKTLLCAVAAHRPQLRPSFVTKDQTQALSAIYIPTQDDIQNKCKNTVFAESTKFKLELKRGHGASLFADPFE